MNAALKFYTSILKDINVDVDEKGALIKTLPDGKTQAIKDTKTGVPFAIPTNELLRNHIDDYTFFNPLAEHLNRGESRVIQALRGWVIFHYCELAQAMALELMEAAADMEVQKKMSTRQAAYLKQVGPADQKTVDALAKVIRATDRAPSRRFLTIFMAMSQNVKQNWLRQANLSFPVLDGDEDEPPFETKGLRKSDVRAIRGMMKYIYGGLYEAAQESEGGYVAIGSADQVAPYFDSLVQTIIQLGTLFRTKAKLHRKVLTKDLYDKCNVSLDWVEQLSNYSDYRKMVPPIDNDDDESVKGAPQPKAPAPTKAPSWSLQAGSTPTPQQPQMVPQAPVAPPAPRSSGGAKSLAEFNADRARAAQQQAQQQFDPYRAAQNPYAPQPMMTPHQMVAQQGYGYGPMGTVPMGAMPMPGAAMGMMGGYGHQPAGMLGGYQQPAPQNRAGTLTF